MVIGDDAIDSSANQAWPIPGLSLQWVRRTLEQSSVRNALRTSVRAGLSATAVALLLGSLAAFAVQPHRFRGRESIPIWVLQNYTRTSGLPIVNAVALILILVSIIPVYIAQRLAGAESAATR